MALSVSIGGNDISSNVAALHAIRTVESGQIATAKITLRDESQSLSIDICDAVVIQLDGADMWKGEVAGPPQLTRVADDVMREVVYCEGYGKLLHESVLTETEMIRTWPVIESNTGSDRFEIEGDHTALFVNGYQFLIRDSTGNDGTWTVDSSSLQGGPTRTLIDVQEDVTDGTDDGVVVEIIADDAIISDLMDYVDIDNDASADVDGSTHVSQLKAQFEHGLTLGPSTVAEAMEKIAEITGGRWWVDMDKALYYTNLSSKSGVLSEDPEDVGGSTYRCWDLTVKTDQNIITSVLVVGVSADGDTISQWVQADSGAGNPLTEYGHREALLVDASINTTNALEDAGQRIIDANEEPNVSATCKTWHSVDPGDSVGISSDAYGYDDVTFFIRKIEMDFVRRNGADDVLYTVHLGDSQFDAVAAQANTDRRLRKLETRGVGTTISSGGGGGTATDAEYLVLTLSSDLSVERQFVAGTGLDDTDAGANNTYTVDVDVGIADDKIVQMDDADAADNDYARFTANGLEGRSYAEMVDTDLAEEIQDLVGAMTSGNTETGIAVTYQDGDGTIDFVVSQEQIEDWAGAMFSGNTETFITATYQDGDGTVDLVVPVKDEDNMVSDSDTDLATQQSIKAYVDTEVSGASYAPNDAQYVVLAVDGDLSAERTLNPGTGLSGTDAGANGNYTLDVDVGIADDKIMQVDDADAADNDYARFTASGLEGRSYAEVLSDLSGQATGAFDFNSQDVTVANLIIADAGNIGSASDNDAIAIAADGSVTLTVQQIADNHVLTVDDADAADDDWARFTANGLEGYSDSEILAELSGDAGAAFSFNDQNITNVGDIAVDSISADATNIGIAADLIPDADNSHDLGSASYQYAEAHVVDMHVKAFTSETNMSLAGGVTITKSRGKVSRNFTIPISSSITDVDTAAEKFMISGDHTANISAADTFVVSGSTGNDATWTVDSVSYDAGDDETDITVTGDITDATADGEIGFQGTLYVEDHEGIADTAVFTASDYVLLQVIDTSGGGLATTDVYGQVTSYADDTGGEQHWTWTTTTQNYTAADTIYAGSLALDYGAANDGLWEVTVLGDGPFSEVSTWDTVTNGEPDNFTTHVHLGNMRNTYGVGANDYYGIGVGDYSSGDYLLYNTNDGFSINVGGGAISLEDEGIIFDGTTAFDDGQLIEWRDSGTMVANIYMPVAAGSPTGWIIQADGVPITILTANDGDDIKLECAGDVVIELGDAVGGDSLSITDSGGTQVAALDSNGNFQLDGTLTIDTVAAAGTDTDKFLVLDGSDNVDYRTGDNVRSDLGLATTDDVTFDDLRLSSGLYVGGTGTDPDDDDIHYDGNLKSVKSATTYDCYAFHPLTTNATSTSWDGDAKAADSDGTIDLSTAFSLPADIVAVAVRLAVQDETVGVGCYLGAAVGEVAVQVVTAVANQYVHGSGVCPCSSGDIYWGTNGELDNVYVEVVGYWI